MSKKFLSILAATYLCAATAAIAAPDTVKVPAKPGTAKMSPQAEKVRAAAEECRAKIGKDSQGRYDQNALRECMEKKGIKPPKMAPLTEEQKKAQAAFKECRETVKKDTQGRADREEMKKCVEKKGIKISPSAAPQGTKPGAVQAGKKPQQPANKN